MRLLVTGARGFLGGAVGAFAVSLGWDVLGIGRASQAPADWLGEYQWSDVAQSDLSGVIKQFKPDLIFHGAGAASVQNSILHPFDDFRASVLTFASILDAVRRSDHTPTIIFPSSAAVYGNPSSLPIKEESPLEPISPYGFHKLQCEMLAREFAASYGIRVVVCRIFSLFGFSQRRLLIWELFNQFNGSSECIKLKGTGEETRDYLWVDDAAEVMLNFAMATTEFSAVVPCYNIASGNETSVRKLVQLMAEICQSRKQVEVASSSPMGDPARWQANVEKSMKLLPTWTPPDFRSRLEQVIGDWKIALC